MFANFIFFEKSILGLDANLVKASDYRL